MGATLTAPGSVLSRLSASAAWGVWSPPRSVEMITRPGNGGPRRHGGVLVYRSLTLAGECTSLRGVPTTSALRTLLDVAGMVSDRALARMLREAVRLELFTVDELARYLADRRHRRGATRLMRAVARYAGLPLERARSGAEIRALEVLRRADCPLPRLNFRIAGEEADLSWPAQRLIIEVDGGPFHLDVGEDARKQSVWEGAGWTVRRISSDDVYDRPHLLVRLAPRFVPERSA